MALSGFRRVHRKYALLIASLFFVASSQADWLHKDVDIMGTRITVELFHPDQTIAQQGVDAVIDEMKRIDQDMSPWIETSQLARLNRGAAKQPIIVSSEFFDLIQRSLYFSRLTNGAFDITFASAGFLYNYRAGIRPDDQQLQQAAALIDYRNLKLDKSHSTIRYSKPGVRIDLGGIAKGHAVDRSITLLQSLGIKQARVTAGGDSRMIGERREHQPWNIGVRDPDDENKLVAVIPLQDVAVSTSGDYQRYFDEDGIRYHHIINPVSGDSARGLRSVSIIGPDATTTDALSTSIFVLGLTKGMNLINQLTGIDAILVDAQGRLHYSEDLMMPAKKSEQRVKTTSESVAN